MKCFKQEQDDFKRILSNIFSISKSNIKKISGNVYEVNLFRNEVDNMKTRIRHLEGSNGFLRQINCDKDGLKLTITLGEIIL